MKFVGGDVPAVPLLAAMPDTEFALSPLVLVLPALIGAFVGWTCRKVSERPTSRFRAVLVAAITAGVGSLVLAATAGGRLAAGAFDPVTVPAGLLALLVAMWVLVPGVLVAWLAGSRVQPEVEAADEADLDEEAELDEEVVFEDDELTEQLEVLDDDQVDDEYEVVDSDEFEVDEDLEDDEYDDDYDAEDEYEEDDVEEDDEEPAEDEDYEAEFDEMLGMETEDDLAVQVELDTELPETEDLDGKPGR